MSFKTKICGCYRPEQFNLL